MNEAKPCICDYGLIACRKRECGLSNMENQNMSEPEQQLVARIKRSSKYYGQTGPGEWFDVRVVGDRSYRLRGNNNNYRIGDVALAMRLENGEIVELKDAR